MSVDLSGTVSAAVLHCPLVAVRECKEKERERENLGSLPAKEFDTPAWDRPPLTPSIKSRFPSENLILRLQGARAPNVDTANFPVKKNSWPRVYFHMSQR